jgi:hypothetical protein
MAKDKIILSDIVERTLLIPNLAVKKPWYKHINWIDQLCATVNLIPSVGDSIAGEIKAITDVAANYQASEFLRKFTTFIYELGDFGDNERILFLKELEESAQDASGNVMLSIIDRLDNIHKQKMLANLVRAKGEGKITIEEFFRLESVLQRIPYVDLKQLPLYQTEYYDDNGDSELLYSTGVLRPAVYHQDGDKYVLSPLGVNLMKYGLWLSIEMPQIKGTFTGIAWETVGEVPDIEGVKDIVKKTIEDQRYQESDQAMFDYDVVRGK